MQDSITKILKAIADPTRRELFHVLVVAASALPISQLAAQFDMSRQGVTKHLKTLEEAGLIATQASGRERYCSAKPASLKEVNKWLQTYEQFWGDALGKLGTYLDTTSKT